MMTLQELNTALTTTSTTQEILAAVDACEKFGIPTISPHCFIQNEQGGVRTVATIVARLLKTVIKNPKVSVKEALDNSAICIGIAPPQGGWLVYENYEKDRNKLQNEILCLPEEKLVIAGDGFFLTVTQTLTAIKNILSRKPEN